MFSGYSYQIIVHPSPTQPTRIEYAIKITDTNKEDESDEQYINWSNIEFIGKLPHLLRSYIFVWLENHCVLCFFFLRFCFPVGSILVKHNIFLYTILTQFHFLSIDSDICKWLCSISKMEKSLNKNTATESTICIQTYTSLVCSVLISLREILMKATPPGLK